MILRSIVACCFLLTCSYSFSQTVIPATGDLLLEEPLVTIPTVNGPDVQVTATYRSGVRVDQVASEIGLGWELKYGSRIMRTVNGIPDDWQRVATYAPSVGDFDEETGFIAACGTIHTTRDLHRSREEDTYYYDLSKDQYAISGPVLSGAIEPFIFEFKSIESDEGSGEFDFSEITVRPEFVMEESFHGDMESANYYPWSNAPVDGSSEVVLPGAPASFSGTEYYTAAGTSRPVSSFHVEYFTNAEILAKRNAGSYEFFVEPSEGIKRQSPTGAGSFDQLIGAFRITDPSGFVYHYSLPVYLNYSTYGQYPLEENYDPIITSNQNLNRKDQNGNYYIRDLTTNAVVEYRQESKYAITWNLTAVTGPDFKDVNQNHVIDEEDEGYWVKYNYEMIQQSFSHREPLLGHEVSYVGKTADNDLTGYLATFRSTDAEVYLLKSVETKDYVALNIWDIRNDEHGSIDHDLYDPQITVETNIATTGGAHNMPAMGSTTLANNFSGALFDNGGPDNDYYGTGSTFFTIDPPGATQVSLTFHEHEFMVSSSVNNPLNPIYSTRLSQLHCMFNQTPNCIYFYDPNANCSKQWLKFYDGPDNTYPAIEVDGVSRFCGTNGGDLVPRTITSSESGSGDAAITVEMHVDGYGNFPQGNGYTMLSDQEFGFRAKWRSAGYYHAFQENWKGTLYDDGGPTGNYQNNKEYLYTIQPEGADGVYLDFQSIALDNGDFIEVYEGASASGAAALTLIHGSAPTTYTCTTTNAVTLRFKSDGSGSDAGFKLQWQATWDERFPVDPGFKLSSILLLHRDDFEDQLFPESITASATSFRFNNLIDQGRGIYNSDWFNANATLLKSRTLYAVEFDQDYSLAKGYVNNINVNADNTTKLDNMTDIMPVLTNGDHANSGKLTLNRIRRLGLGYVQTEPSVLFEYDMGGSNPDYDARKEDTWGYYKSDGIGGYNTYRNSTSAGGADAWSLKEVTTALGAEVKVIYESDQIAGVLQDDMSGGLDNSVRIYNIVDVAEGANAGKDWTIYFDEDATELTSLLTSTTHTVNIFIPFKCGNDSYHTFNQGTVAYSGTPGQYTVTGLSIFDEFNNTDATSFFYCGTSLTETPGAYALIELSTTQSYPGGGIRVASIEHELTASEGYTQSYTYEAGVTPPAFDRYARPRKVEMGIEEQYTYLRPYANFAVGIYPNVVYSSTTISNDGRNNNAEGYVKHSFITEPEENEVIQSWVQEHSNHIDTVIEFSSSFPKLFGLERSVEVFDKNNLMVSKQVNHYDTYQEGALTELLDVVILVQPSAGGGGGTLQPPVPYNKILLRRDLDVRLQKRETFDQSLVTTDEFISWDSVNGMPKLRKQTTGEHEQLIETFYAYDQSQFASMGPKSLNASYSNQLVDVSEREVQVDATQLSTDDFASRTATLFRNNALVRQRQSGACNYAETTESNSYFKTGVSYAWAGDLGDYGIFDHAAFAAFDFTEASIDEDWLAGEEVVLYDGRGNVLSTENRFGDFTSTRYVFNDRLAYMSIDDCTFQGATASGFEDLTYMSNSAETSQESLQNVFIASCEKEYFEGEVSPLNTYSISHLHHSGKSGLQMTGGAIASYEAECATGSKSDMEAGRLYRASVWVHAGSADDTELRISITGMVAASGYSNSVSVLRSNSSNVQVGQWVQMNVEIDVPAGFSTSGSGKVSVELQSGAEGASVFDDFRFHPVESSLQVLVHDKRTGLVKALLDANNFATFFEHDTRGDVVKKEQEVVGKGVVKTFESSSYYYRGLNN